MEQCICTCNHCWLTWGEHLSEDDKPVCDSCGSDDVDIKLQG
jgi:hypothetical protein